MTTYTKPIFLLVHGGWHAPEAYSPFLKALEAKGYTAVAPELPSGMDPTPDDPPRADSQLIKETAQKLINEGREVVVVAHSYGGTVVTEAFNGLGIRERASKGLSGGIRMVVMVAAFVHEPGMSFENYAPIDKITWNHYEGDYRVINDDADCGALFYQDIPKAEQDKLISKHTKHPRACGFYAPKNPWWGEIDVSFIYAEQDAAFPLPAQQYMVSQLKKVDDNVKEASLDSSHFPLISMPDAVVEKIEEFLA